MLRISFNSADRFISKGEKTNILHSYSCDGLADMVLIARAIKDNRRATRYASKVKSIADYLIRNRDIDRDHLTGWGLDSDIIVGAGRSSATLKRGEEQSFQTSIAGICLVRAYELTRNVKYLDVARQAANTFLPTIIRAGCRDCGYIKYANHPYYDGWLVKNTNAIMGVFYARLAQVTNSSEYWTIARMIANTQAYEVVTNQNYKYFGVDHPENKGFLRYSEFHLIPEMFYSDLLGRLVRNQHTITAGRTLMFYYWNGGCKNAPTNECNMSPQGSHFLYASCGMAHGGNPLPIARCNEYLQTNLGRSKF